jgi:glycosyltransferase involved in cell wall biosynthesis
MHIVFLIRSLNVGGAERQLVAAARGLARRGHRVTVAVFYGGGVFEEELRGEGIAVRDLSKSGRWDTLPFLLRVLRLVRAERPELLVAYMGGANIVSAALKSFFPAVKVVWGIRTAKRDLRAYDWLTRLGPKIERTFSVFADLIVANSEAARRVSIEYGLDADRIVVIPNGIDCARFRPDAAGGERLREEWGIPRAAAVVGIVARLDPVKGHPTFLRAAARLTERVPDAHFVCVGRGKSPYREELAALARELGVAGKVIWAGERTVTSAVYSAFDVTVLSSNDGESFPNTVAESMACGTPCAATDSGDLRAIVGDTGAVVAPGDADALAAGVEELLSRVRSPGSDVGRRARSRIEEQYSVPVLVARTERTLEDVLRTPTRLRPGSGWRGRAA